MMKLNENVKRFIKSSIYETSVNELKYYSEIYSLDQMNRALKIIDYIRIKRGLYIKKVYANCSKVYSNYYKYTHNYLINKHGYSFEHGFYVDRKLSIIA